MNNYYLPDDQIEEFLSIYLATLSDGISSEEEIMEEFNIHTAYVILRMSYDDFTCNVTSFDLISPYMAAFDLISSGSSNEWILRSRISLSAEMVNLQIGGVTETLRPPRSNKVRLIQRLS